MILFSGLSMISGLYTVLYAVHSIRCRRAASAVGGFILSLLCFALSALMLYLLKY